MILKSIRILNFRSIDDLQIDIEELNDKSFTYGLIGVNEAGKSSILRALALKDSIAIIKPTIKDFRNSNFSIDVIYTYHLTKAEQKECLDILKEKMPTEMTKLKLDLSEVDYAISVDKTDLNNVKHELFLHSAMVEEAIENKLKPHLLTYFKTNSLKSVFWKAEDRFLISKPINLQIFSASPSSSIPLQNCFKLAGFGIADIPKQVALLTDSTEREHLQETLGEKVTEHINKVWTKHPIKITFNMSNNLIHFHVKDLNAKEKAKTANQRSDGFRQFISFLLTVSAQNSNGELNNTILLLDEPETHLHPKAQEDLLLELVKITKNKKNNVSFFATHSNYMIDKDNLNRNYKVAKPKDETVLKKFKNKTSSYASVNYDVFEIVSTDYHNELFAKAFYLSKTKSLTDFDKKITELNGGTYKTEKEYNQTKTKKFNCTLCTYIRHQIHHPDNDLNKRFSEVELDKSIKALRLVIEKLKNS